MTEYNPSISVVICSKNRHNLLLTSVEYVKKCDYPADKREIIVVEEGETPASIEGVKYVFLPLKNLGLGYCHNQGIKNASGKIIAFTDDDVKVEGNWLKEIAASFIDPEVYGVAGLVRTQPGNAFGETEEILGLPGGGIQALENRGGMIGETTNLSTCNLAYRKKVFDEFSFLETSFGKYGGDDWYLGKMVSEKYKCVFNPKMLVYHKPKGTPLKLIYTYYRRQITDYLAKRDLYNQSAVKAVFGKKHQCVIFRFLTAIAIVVVFKTWGFLFLFFFYYIFSLLSIYHLLDLIRSKKSFFAYPFVKFITEVGILKGEILVIMSSEKKFDRILDKF